MEKPVKIILYIIVGLVIINFILSLSGSSNLSSIRKDLQAAKLSADSALNELKNAKDRLDSIKSDMFILKNYVAHVQKSVELGDIQKTAEEERDKKKLSDLRRRADSLKLDIETDSLPHVGIINIKKKS